MNTLRVILNDQLSKNISSLDSCTKTKDTILLCELKSYATHVKHHKKKLAFIFSAMRHFANDLKLDHYNVEYVRLEDKSNSHNLTKEVEKTIQSKNITKLVITHPSEYYVLEEINKWKDKFNIEIDIKEDNRFFCSINEFKNWSQDNKNLLMENFYRKMRKEHNILMEGDAPIGGKWNYDKDNRKVPKENITVPKTYNAQIDDITKEVMQVIENNFSNHFGDLQPFYFAVTHSQALRALHKFIDERLVKFGDYQDAMLENEPWMFHSHLSFYLNSGILSPLECIKAAEAAYHEENAPLNAVEGFIRQILGWREYVRGIYWLKMPEYSHKNYLMAKRKLPSFYWDAETKMNCIKQCVTETKQNAYAHHIQRLMILGNFALIAGINPKEVNEWYWIVYADAYEWVELPNVSGMILFADGGYLATKPYAASGNYINKMSNYCKNCDYSVSKKTGDNACPFNYLYWDFLSKNQEKLSTNHRLRMPYVTYNKMSDDKKDQIKNSTDKFLSEI